MEFISDSTNFLINTCSSSLRFLIVKTVAKIEIPDPLLLLSFYGDIFLVIKITANRFLFICIQASQVKQRKQDSGHSSVCANDARQDSCLDI